MPSPRAADDARRPARSQHRTCRSRAALAVAATLVTLLTGCTGDSAAEPTPTRTASATPTPTPEPTPTPTTTPAPERPAAMDDPGVDGAVATATYFMELFGYVGGGDLTEWKSLSHPECEFCSNVSTEVERMASLGHRQVGPRLEIVSTDPAVVDPGVFYGVDFEYVEHSWQELDGGGNVVEQRQGDRRLKMLMNIVRVDGRWLVRSGQAVEAQ